MNKIYLLLDIFVKRSQVSRMFLNEDLLSIIGLYSDLSTYHEMSKINSQTWNFLMYSGALKSLIKAKIPKISVDYLHRNSLPLFKLCVYISYHNNLEVEDDMILEPHLRNTMKAMSHNVPVDDKPFFDYCIEVFQDDDVDFFEFQMNELRKHYSFDEISLFINIHIHLCKPKILNHIITYPNFKRSLVETLPFGLTYMFQRAEEYMEKVLGGDIYYRASPQICLNTDPKNSKLVRLDLYTYGPLIITNCSCVDIPIDCDVPGCGICHIVIPKGYRDESYRSSVVLNYYMSVRGFNPNVFNY